jgi:basic membrane protein A and related proteins
MKRRLTLFLSLVLVFSLVLMGCSTDDAKEDNTGDSDEQKIAFITGTGGLGDKSFNDLGHEGVEKLKEEGIQVDVAEPTAIADLEGIIRNFADTEEYALIITMGGDSVDSVNAVSADYPDQPMLIIDGFAGNENVKSVILSQVDTSFLVGAYAGLMEKGGHLPKSQGDNTIGIVGGMDIPIIRSLVAGYKAGARYVNPDIEVLVTYVGAWNDPGKGSELAQSLYSQGADIIFQAAGGSGLGALEAAEKVDLYALGYDGNQNGFYPDNMLASGIRGLGDMVYSTAKDTLAGNYEGGDYDIAMKDNPMTSQLTMEESNLETPDEVLQQLEKIKEFLIEAKVKIPAEPDEIDAYIEQVGSFED